VFLPEKKLHHLSQKKKLHLIKMRLVVAHYQEDLSWLREAAQICDVTVYHKDARYAQSCVSGVREEHLPNIGREGHTYYQHVVKNYDHLDDVTVFCQGHPFDHSPNFLDLLRALSTCGADQRFGWISEWRILCSLQGCVLHTGLPLLETYQRIFAGCCDPLRGCQSRQFLFGAGAQFWCTRDCIQARPRSLFARIVEVLAHDVNPVEGFCVERFHGLVFDPPDQGDQDTDT